MRGHLKYLKYVLRHKAYVYIAGRKLGLPILHLLKHDLSKFSRAEWTPYVNRFHGGRGGALDKSKDDAAFLAAWKHHWRHNPHHPEYWVDPVHQHHIDSRAAERTVKLDCYAYEMPDVYVREMCADWYGAGMAQGKPHIWYWYSTHKDLIPLNPKTRALAEYYLIELLERMEG